MGVVLAVAMILVAVAACSSPPPAPSVTDITATVAATDIYVGGTYQAEAEVTVTGGGSDAVTWHSSHPEVISIGDTGEFRAHTAGNAVITATSTLDTARSASVPLTVVSAMAGLKVMYFSDITTHEPNTAFDALTQASLLYGFDLTTVVDGACAAGMFDDGYDLVFHYRRNQSSTAAELTALEQYVPAGGLLVYGAWNVGDSDTTEFVEGLGAPFTAETNYGNVTITDPELAEGLSSSTLVLTNTWGPGTFSTSHNAPVAGSGVWATYPEDSTAAIVSSPSGQVTVVGVFEDAFGAADGQRFFTNLFNKVARLALEAP